MLPLPIRLRRGRRADFVAVMEVLALSGMSMPPADRAALRRFRRLTADLGADFYVAVRGQRIVGLVHVTYTRQLATAAQARLELLVVAPAARRQRIGTALAALAAQRARRRGCAELRYEHTSTAAGADRFLAGTGWQRRGTVFSTDPTAGAD